MKKNKTFRFLRCKLKNLLQEKKEDDLCFGYKILLQDLRREPSKKELKQQENEYYKTFYRNAYNKLTSCKNLKDIKNFVIFIDEQCETDWLSIYEQEVAKQNVELI